MQVSDLPRSERGSATDHTLRFHDDATSLIRHLTAVATPPKPVKVPTPPTQPKPKPKPKTKTGKAKHRATQKQGASP